ncbi:MAG: ribosomal-processing cysteine protease Prp [Clostridiales bacterium]|nr:ribosomal-processing cysteine protease Prp [Clostridiales bacterium]
MTTAAFHMEGDRIVSFDISGHSGYGEEGSDIVCAAISAVAGMVECTFNEVLGLAAAVKLEPDSGHLSLRLPGGLSEMDENTCQTMLVGMMVYLTALHEDYPDYIEVMEV